MTDFESQPDVDDELLSAYLDDELAPEERARVEARLSADAAARQLVEQLRAASQAIRDLPAAAVGHDLRESVLQRAEQAMLSSRGAKTAADSESTRAANANKVEPLDSLPQFTIGRTKRGWAWAAMAVAAALLIMFVQREGNQQVTMRQAASTTDRSVGEKQTAVNGPEMRALNDVPSAAEQPALVTREPIRDEASPLSNTVKELSDHDGKEVVAFDAVSGAAGAPAPSSAPAVSGVASNSVSDGSVPREANGAAEPTQPQDVRLGTLATDARSTLEHGLGQPEGSVGGESGQLPSDRFGASGPATAASPPPRPPIETLGLRGGGEMASGRRAAGRGAADTSAANSTATPTPPATVGDLVVVHVVVKRDALESKAFDRVLAMNGIALEIEDELAESPASVDGNAVAAVAKSLPQQSTSSSDTAEEKKMETSGERPTDAELVLVEAPPMAIYGCVSDVNQDEANFVSVAVSDAADASADIVDDAQANQPVAENLAAKKLAVEWGMRYNRGAIPSAQEEDVSRAKQFYHFNSEANRNWAGTDRGGFGGGGSEFSGGRAIESLSQTAELGVATSESAAEEKDKSQVSNQGRALRMRNWDSESSRFNEGQPRRQLGRNAAPAAEQQAGEGRASETLPAGASGKLRALFILSPDAPPQLLQPAATAPPSPPTENRAE